MTLQAVLRGGNLLEESATVRMLQETPAGIWLVDPAGTTVWVNEAAGELVGIPAEELVGARAPEFLVGTDPQPFADLRTEQQSDRTVTRPDGTTIWVLTTAKPLFEDSGGRAGTLFTLFEINQRKEREVELRMRLEANEALVELAELSFDAPSLSVLLARSVALVAEQLDATLASISTVDLKGGQLQVLVAAARDEVGWAKELQEGGPIRFTDHSPARTAIEQDEPVVIEDFDRDPRFVPHPQLKAHGIRSIACVPLDDGESVLSALGDEPDAVGRSALPLIESVARMIAGYRIHQWERTGNGCADSAPRSGTGSVGRGRRSVPSRPSRHDRRPGSA